MLISKTGIKPMMYGYVVEQATNPDTLKIFVSEAFLDKTASNQTTSLYKSDDIFINTIKPTVSQSVVSKNYITAKVRKTSNYVSSNTHLEHSSFTYNVGDQVLVAFINSNPAHGNVLGK